MLGGLHVKFGTPIPAIILTVSAALRAAVSHRCTVNHLLKDTFEMQPPLLTGHHCSAPFHIPYIDMCTFTVTVCNKNLTLYIAAYYGSNGVLSIEVSLYRPA